MLALVHGHQMCGGMPDEGSDLISALTESRGQMLEEEKSLEPSGTCTVSRQSEGEPIFHQPCASPCRRPCA